MHIKTTCPHCETTYQLDPSLRGKVMRCPNSGCRQVFEVRADGEAPAAPPQGSPPRSHQSGTVGDLVPILQAEAIAPPPTVEVPSAPPPVRTRPAAAPATESPAPAPPRPVRRVLGTAPAAPSPPKPPAAPPRPQPPKSDIPEPPKPLPPPAPPQPEPAESEDPFDLLRELGLAPDAAPSADGPPPAADAPAAGPVELGPDAWAAPPVRGGTATPAPAPGPAPTERPRRRRKRRPLVAVVLLLLVAGGAVVAGLQVVRSRQAGGEAERYDKAMKEYSERNYNDAAVLFRSLDRDFPESPDRDKYRFHAEFSDALEGAFAARSPEDIGRAFERLAQFAAEHSTDERFGKGRAEVHAGFHKLARELVSQAKEKTDPVLLSAAGRVLQEADKHRPASVATPVGLAEEIAAVEKAIAARQLREGVLAALGQRLARPTALGVREARELARAAGLSEDAEVKATLEKLPEAHLAAVRYVAVRSGPADDRPPEDPVPSLLTAAPLDRHRGSPWPGRPVLALARGVLYALAPHDGGVLWAARVGGETAPPLWLEPTEVAPASVLVASADGSVLSVFDGATGAPRWRRRLGAACVGEPVLVGGSAFAATAGGRVEEIEIQSGSLLGYYDLGQPLAGGPARQPGTNKLLVPADGYAVYVLDVARRRCEAVLYTDHAAGALLGPPQVLPGGGKSPAAYLLLREADGLDAASLRAFALPAETPDARPLPPEVRLKGWTWFRPWSDGERFALVTDRGEFLLARAGDGAAALRALMRTRVDAPAGPRLKALIAHAEGDDFWIVVGGGLRRIGEGFARGGGPGLTAPTAELATVGSPLQPGQVRAGGAGGPLLYLVTQAAEGGAALVTAVDTRTDEVVWRRQLGAVAAGRPAALAGGVVMPDLTGSLFLFHPEKRRDLPGGWREGGRRLAGAGEQVLLAGPGGRILAVSEVRREKGAALTVRVLAAGAEPGAPRDLALDALPAGPPAAVGEALVIALSDGRLVRQPLGDGPATPGPDWRAAHADAGAAAHVVALPGGDVLVTDGSRGLSRYHCDAGGWEKRASTELPARVAAAPAVTASDHVWAADADGTLTLLRAEDLRKVRAWPLGGSLTAGPLARGGRALCVLGGRRLVCFDPESSERLWSITFRAGIVGEPDLVEGLLVVADERGRVVALDPATGKEAGEPYQIEADAAPAAAPLPFGPDRLFVPLTDGTALLLPRPRGEPPGLWLPWAR